MARNSPQPDVAISFLDQDLGVAQELRDRLAPALDVFVKRLDPQGTLALTRSHLVLGTVQHYRDAPNGSRN
jgi:hypothetical protein